MSKMTFNSEFSNSSPRHCSLQGLAYTARDDASTDGQPREQVTNRWANQGDDAEDLGGHRTERPTVFILCDQLPI